MEVPSQIGQWKIGKKLGEGAFSSVYKCSRDGEEASWAIKISPYVAASFKRSKESDGERPCRLLAHENTIYNNYIRNHPHFPKRPTSNFGDKDGWRFIVMEYFSGGTLKSFMEKNHVSTHVIFSCGLRILSAIHYLHEQLVIFGDLKPENIMIIPKELDFDSRGLALIDFGGCWKFISPKGTYDSIRFAGTPMFMSRAVHNRESGSRRDDLESLAYLLAWMLSDGSLPWAEARSEEEILKMKQNPRVIDSICKKSQELKQFFDIVFKLELKDIPDYDKLRSLLIKAGGEPSGPIDWTEPVSSTVHSSKKKQTRLSKKKKSELKEQEELTISADDNEDEKRKSSVEVDEDGNNESTREKADSKIQKRGYPQELSTAAKKLKEDKPLRVQPPRTAKSCANQTILKTALILGAAAVFFSGNPM